MHLQNKIIMIGSLGQFIPLNPMDIFQDPSKSKRDEAQLSIPKITKRRGNSTFQNYVPQDKADLLLRYEKNNIFSINRKKFNSLAKQSQSKQTFRKPLFQHKSFFVKPQIARDYIANQQLKRKHNLLRAILRMKQNEEQPKGQSDYQQSFQRLYSGFKSIHPEPMLHIIRDQDYQSKQIAPKIPIPASLPKNMNGISPKKRLQYEYCLNWAKKHRKNGDFFARQLGKLQRNEQKNKDVVSRSLIDEISKKVQFNMLEG